MNIIKSILTLFITTAILAVALICNIGCSSEQNNGVKVFVNGDIITMDDSQPAAEAVAVKDGKILAVGSRTEAEEAAGSGAELVDLGGKTLMPGFIDSHSHLSLVGTKLALANMSYPPAGPITSIEDIKQGFREWIEEKNIEPGGLVAGSLISHKPKDSIITS